MTLQITNLDYDYGAPLLAGLALQVEPGQIAMILGPSGIGKSTLLRVIAGHEDPAAGQVCWDGAELGKPEDRGVAWMTQEPLLLEHTSLQRNVAIAGKHLGKDKLARATDALAAVGLEAHQHKRPGQCSGGQKQRACLARAMVSNSRMLLLDEPLASLDRELRVQLATQIQAFVRDRGIAAVWVTHDETEAATFGDACYLLKDGQLIPYETGPLRPA